MTLLSLIQVAQHHSYNPCLNISTLPLKLFRASTQKSRPQASHVVVLLLVAQTRRRSTIVMGLWPRTTPRLWGTQHKSWRTSPRGPTWACRAAIRMRLLRSRKEMWSLGSGGGFDVFIAARKVGSTGRSIGIDMAPGMTQKARRNAIKFSSLSGQVSTTLGFVSGK